MPAYCKSCGYDLQGLAMHGRCPDCGEFFSRISNKNVTDAPVEKDLSLLARAWLALRRLLGWAD